MRERRNGGGGRGEEGSGSRKEAKEGGVCYRCMLTSPGRSDLRESTNLSVL